MSFSIKQLLLSVVFVALGLMALMNAARPYVAPAVQLFNFIVLAVLSYGVWLKSGEQRAFRVGFVAWFVAASIFGISPNLVSEALVRQIAPLFVPKPTTAAGSNNPFGYFGPALTASSPVVAVSVDSGGDSVTPISTLSPSSSPASSDTVAIEQSGSSSPFDDLFPSSTSGSQTQTGQPASVQIGQVGTNYYEWENNFKSICNGLFAMFLGFIGGWVTVFVYRKRQRMLRSGGTVA